MTADVLVRGTGGLGGRANPDAAKVSVAAVRFHAASLDVTELRLGVGRDR